jgi:hypothetical protein
MYFFFFYRIRVSHQTVMYVQDDRECVYVAYEWVHIMLRELESSRDTLIDGNTPCKYYELDMVSYNIDSSIRAHHNATQI